MRSPELSALNPGNCPAHTLLGLPEQLSRHPASLIGCLLQWTGEVFHLGQHHVRWLRTFARVSHHDLLKPLGCDNLACVGWR